MAADRDKKIAKLILGTAQFGLNYGISNTRGQIAPSEVNFILTEAGKAGITTLDTAAAYGEKIGISLYHPHEAQELLDREVAIDIVQFPYSVFDRRFDAILPQLRQAGIETHVRSVYLQGLYFMQPSGLSAHFKPIAQKLEKLQFVASKNNLPLGALLLGFVLANPFVSNVVLGVESLQTLQENILYCGIKLSETILTELQTFTETNEDILLPYKWPAQ